MEILKLDCTDRMDEKIKRAAGVLKSGGLVIYPTDTLYGLGANALDENAVKMVFEVKNRPPDMPIPVAVNSIEMMKGYAIMGENEVEFAKSFLPGALTLILRYGRLENPEKRHHPKAYQICGRTDNHHQRKRLGKKAAVDGRRGT